MLALLRMYSRLRSVQSEPCTRLPPLLLGEPQRPDMLHVQRASSGVLHCQCGSHLCFITSMRPRPIAVSISSMKLVLPAGAAGDAGHVGAGPGSLPAA